MKRLLVVALAFAAGASAEFPHVDPKLAARKMVIHKAVILPALITFQTVGVKGPEGGVTQSDEVAAVLASTVAKEMAARGVELLPNPLEAAKDDAARYAVADLQAKFDSVAVQLNRSPGKVEKGAFTLGDKVSQFAPGEGADVLVFLRGKGEAATPGRTAMHMGMPESSFQGEIVLVDAKSGEVLFFVRFQHFRNVAKKTEERFAESVHRAVHDMPLPLPPPKN